MRNYTSIILAALLLTSCALKDAPTRTEITEQALPESTEIPSSWQQDAQARTVADNWLSLLNDPALDAIVAEAIAYNLDLRQAAERVRIAQQNLVLVGAQLKPLVGAQLGARTVRDFDANSSFDSTTAFVGVGWELDIWGRLRAQRAAAEAGYQATALDYAYARQSLAALTAKSWYLAIETRQLVDLSNRGVAVFAELLKLSKMRREAGKDSDLDVANVSAQLATANSQLESSKQAFGEARRSLEVLLGRYPSAEIAVATAFPQLPPPTATGVPAQLLERRPDIVAAERVVLAAFRQTESARLALLPGFSIGLTGGRLGDQLLTLLDLNPWLGGAGIGMSIPIYEGGALRAQVEIATAQQEQAVAQYGAVVLDAFREAEDAIANESLLAKRIPFLKSALVDRIQAVEIATVQYQAGRRDLLWVSELQAQQLLAEEALIRISSAQGANLIRLYLALGGSFDSTPSVPADMSSNQEN